MSKSPNLTGEELENLVADLGKIRRTIGPGCTRHDLRNVTASFREIANGRFLNAWQALGLERQPVIRCKYFTGSGIDNRCIVVSGGAEEAPESLSIPGLGDGFSTIPGTGLVVKMVGMGEDGEYRTVLQNRPSMGFLIYGDGPLLDANPFEERDAKLTKFFEGTVVFFKGLRISRAAVVRHIASERGGVHYGKSSAIDAKITDALAFLATDLIFRRDAEFYVYHSILQDFCRSPDIERFEAAAIQSLSR